MKSSTWVSLPLIFFSFSYLNLIPSPPFLLSVNAHNLSLLRGMQTLKEEDQGPQLSSANTQTPPYTSIFPARWLYPCFTCTHLNQKEHISQHKWVKQVILKHSWAGKEGCLNSADFHLVLRFLLRIFVAFYVYAQHFSIIDCSMNIPQQKMPWLQRMCASHISG